MNRTLALESLRDAMAPLERANRAFSALYPGESGRRQPVHVVYGGAHLFKADTARRLGSLALRSLQEFAPDAPVLARAVGLKDTKELAETVYTRVVEKLHREPVEDFRLDFEDGYGNRPDAEEDGHAASAAAEVASGLVSGGLPPFIGIRIKPLNEELRARSIRTLDIFLTTLLEKTAGRLPANFVVTVPKVTVPEQMAAAATLFDLIEPPLGLPAGSLKMEMMVETTQSICGPHGGSNLPRFLAAARGRCIAAHFGVYDYTAGCSITAEHQHMLHPACDFARCAMQVALAGTGVWLSDGATNIMPIPPRRSEEEDRAVVHAAWRLQFKHIRHSLANAFYQGWDLHPAQLPTRYAAVYSFFLEGVPAASERLRNFISKAAQATLVGDVFDDAATGQGLLNFFLRAMNCGAIPESETPALTGLTLEELRSASFVKMLNARRAAGTL